MGVFDELEDVVKDIKNRLALTEKIGLLFLTPLDDEISLECDDIKRYVDESPDWHHYTEHAYHYRPGGRYTADDPLEVQMDWQEMRWNEDEKLKLLLLHIAACEGRRPEKLYDEIWPHKRDAITRLADVETD